MSLNEYQSRAVQANGHCLITACPGSGKTRVLSVRAARLLREGVGNLVAVTFTAASALELRERILAQAPEAENRVIAGTFHSLALRQLKASGMRKLRLVTGGEQRMLLLNAYEHNCPGEDFEEVVKAIENYKTTLAPPPPRGDSEIVDAYYAYQDLLANGGLIDFMDLMLLAIRGMQDGSVKPLDAAWILGDEAQDQDAIQYAWMNAHIQAGTEVTLVADDDQSIYGWRHALGYGGLAQFVNDNKAEHVTLPINYRCGRLILEPAARLINHNTARVEKSIRAGAGTEGEVRVEQCGAERTQEAWRIAQRLAEDKGEGWAVLSRTRRLLECVASALRIHNVPFTYSGPDMWQRTSAAAIAAILGSVGRQDTAGVLVALHYIGISNPIIHRLSDKLKGNTEKERLSYLLHRMEEPPKTLIGKEDPLFKERLARTSRLFTGWMDLDQRGWETHVIEGVVDFVRQHTKKDTHDYEVCGWCQVLLENLKGTIIQRIGAATGTAPGQKNSKDKETKGAVLMSLHGSKGLEWDKVWIMGVEDGRIPHLESPIEEERRLFYVGMTRARHLLVCSHTEDREKGIVRSPFLIESGLVQI